MHRTHRHRAAVSDYPLDLFAQQPQHDRMTTARHHYHLPCLIAVPIVMAVEPLTMPMDLHNIAVALQCHCPCNYCAHKIWAKRRANALEWSGIWWSWWCLWSRWWLIGVGWSVDAILLALLMIGSPVSSCRRYRFAIDYKSNVAHAHKFHFCIKIARAMAMVSQFIGIKHYVVADSGIARTNERNINALHRNCAWLFAMFNNLHICNLL